MARSRQPRGDVGGGVEAEEGGPRGGDRRGGAQGPAAAEALAALNAAVEEMREHRAQVTALQAHLAERVERNGGGTDTPASAKAGTHP